MAERIQLRRTKGWRKYWLVFVPSAQTHMDCYTTDQSGVHVEGWSEAIPVALPEPVVTARTCGCGIAPDGAPGAEGCDRWCMTPTLVTIDKRVDVDMQTGAIHDGSGESYTADGARRLAAALLAGARYLDATGVTEVRRG